VVCDEWEGKRLDAAVENKEKILARGKLQHMVYALQGKMTELLFINSLYYIEKKVAARNISFC
jgi:hypothetical protein